MKNLYLLLAAVPMVLTACDRQPGTSTEPEPVKVASVSFASTPAVLEVGDTFTFQVVVLPENAADKRVTWLSSDPKVATVTEGVVKAIATGSTTITATTADGGKTAICTVTVDTAENVALGVTIDGVTWATRNVGEPGEFAASPEDYGNYYTLEQAPTVCPSGWRLPMQVELESLLWSKTCGWTRQNGVGGLQSGSGDNVVFLPAAGRLDETIMTASGELGYYWMTPSAPNSKYMMFSSTNSFAESNFQESALTVRCVRVDDNQIIGGDETEVTIDGVTWATRNVDEPGTFGGFPEYYGGRYTYDEAKTACPTGWRLPTRAEFESLVRSGRVWTKQNGVSGSRFGSGDSVIFLPATFRTVDSSDNTFIMTGTYWTSTPASPAGYSVVVEFGSNYVYTEFGNINTRTISVRCVRK